MMRAALWFVGLFALAVALALFAGNNQGMVSLFWPPYRVDISLNMALLALLGLFVLCYASLRGVAVLGQLPEQTRRWRQQQKERKLYAPSSAAWPTCKLAALCAPANQRASAGTQQQPAAQQCRRAAR